MLAIESGTKEAKPIIKNTDLKSVNELVEPQPFRKPNEKIEWKKSIISPIKLNISKSSNTSMVSMKDDVNSLGHDSNKYDAFKLSMINKRSKSCSKGLLKKRK